MRNSSMMKKIHRCVPYPVLILSQGAPRI